MPGVKEPVEANSKASKPPAAKAVPNKPALTLTKSNLLPKPSKARNSSKTENQTSGEKRKRGNVTKMSKTLSSSQPNLNNGLEANASVSSSGRTSANSSYKKKPRTKVKPKRGQGSSKKADMSSKEHPDMKPKRTLGPENKSPIFSLDIKTQNTRLVTVRQRQEIYALNRLMTTLENERFKTLILEKAQRGDSKRQVSPLDDVFL